MSLRHRRLWWDAELPGTTSITMARTATDSQQKDRQYFTNMTASSSKAAAHHAAPQTETLGWELCTGRSNSALTHAMPNVGAEKLNHHHVFFCCANRKELDISHFRLFAFVYVKSSSPCNPGPRIELLCTTVWHKLYFTMSSVLHPLHKVPTASRVSRYRVQSIRCAQPVINMLAHTELYYEDLGWKTLEHSPGITKLIDKPGVQCYLELPFTLQVIFPCRQHLKKTRKKKMHRCQCVNQFKCEKLTADIQWYNWQVSNMHAVGED